MLVRAPGGKSLGQRLRLPPSLMFDVEHCSADLVVRWGRVFPI
jgi:hypothetical protein